MAKKLFKCEQCSGPETEGMDGWFTIIEPAKSFVLCPKCYLMRWQQMQPKTEQDALH